MPAMKLELSKYLEELIVGIGPRLIGSPANQAAADYIRDTFSAAGLQLEEQRLPLHRMGRAIRALRS